MEHAKSPGKKEVALAQKNITLALRLVRLTKLDVSCAQRSGWPWQILKIILTILCMKRLKRRVTIVPVTVPRDVAGFAWAQGFFGVLETGMRCTLHSWIRYAKAGTH